jgi:hypothetical protein
MSGDASEKLFSYGTLRLADVQLATFGRLLEGREDTLPGFALSMIAISDPAVVATSGQSSHPILKRTGDPKDEIAGTVFAVTEAELAAADAYEVADYKRIAVRLKSGTEAFVYVDADT